MSSIENIHKRIRDLQQEMTERQTKHETLLRRKGAILRTSPVDMAELKKINEQISKLEKERTGYTERLKALKRNLNTLGTRRNKPINSRSKTRKLPATEITDVKGNPIYSGVIVKHIRDSICDRVNKGFVSTIKSDLSSDDDTEVNKVVVVKCGILTKPFYPNELEVIEPDKDGKGNPIHVNDNVKLIDPDKRICPHQDSGRVIGYNFINEERTMIEVQCGMNRVSFSPQELEVIKVKFVEGTKNSAGPTGPSPPGPTGPAPPGPTGPAPPEPTGPAPPGPTGPAPPGPTGPAPPGPTGPAPPGPTGPAPPGPTGPAAPPRPTGPSDKETVLGGKPLSLPPQLNIQRMSMEKYKALPKKNIPVVIEKSPSEIEAINGYACEVIFDNLSSLGDDAKLWTKMLFFPPEQVFDNTIRHVLPEQICFIILFNELFTSATAYMDKMPARISDSFSKKFDAVKGYMEHIKLISPANEADFESYWDTLQAKYVKNTARTIQYKNIKGAIITDPKYIQQYFDEGLRMFHGEVIEDDKRFFRQLRGSASQPANAMTAVSNISTTAPTPE